MTSQHVKKLLFVCVGNACRSQMAEGFARHFGKGKVEAYSAGSRPAGFIAPEAVQTMKERGIDISGQTSKSMEEFRGREFDVVITMGCGDACPWMPAKLRLDWQIPDPIGKDADFFRMVRDRIESLVNGLLEIHV